MICMIFPSSVLLTISWIVLDFWLVGLTLIYYWKIYKKRKKWPVDMPKFMIVMRPLNHLRYWPWGSTKKILSPCSLSQWRRTDLICPVNTGAVFLYKSRYILGFWLVETAISTNQKHMIYCNLDKNTDPDRSVSFSYNKVNNLQFTTYSLVIFLSGQSFKFT